MLIVCACTRTASPSRLTSTYELAPRRAGGGVACERPSAIGRRIPVVAEHVDAWRHACDACWVSSSSSRSWWEGRAGVGAVGVAEPDHRPFPVRCWLQRSAADGTLYRNAEVEPWVSSNPADRRNLIAVWQQDRWSNGGAQGLLTGVSFDRGDSWRRPTPPPFSRCAGGNACQRRRLRARVGPVGEHRPGWLGASDRARDQRLAPDERDPRLQLPRRRPHVGPIMTLQSDTTAELSTTRSRSRPTRATAASSTRSGIACRSRTPPTHVAVLR